MKHALCLAFVAALVCSCASNNEKVTTKSGLDPENFKAVVDGDTTGLYVLTNENGMEVAITNYGGRIVSVMVPDRNGDLQDVVLGFDNVAAYLPENNKTDFGASIGRYANRIGDARFVLDGDTMKLPVNNYNHCLHGGTDMGQKGWQYRVYKAQQPDDQTLVLSLTDADGNNGFPGTVDATVTFKLLADNAIDIKYSATTDKNTIINLTNHSYFNLSGNPENAITDNLLYINADNFTPVDSTFMTTGEIVPVAGTPMDFTTAHAIADGIDNVDYDQIKNGLGYDHNWVLNTQCNIDSLAASVYSPISGIQLDVYTNEPGIQVYCGNFLDGTVTGKKGIPYERRTAICLETQHYPDSPNKPQWTSVVLKPGETYNSECIYKFTTK